MIKKIIKSYNEGNLVYRIVTSLMFLPGYSNTNIAGLQMKYKTMLYLKKKYKRVLNNNFTCISDGHFNDNKTIWICWFQGIENAPELVKKCYESVCYYMNDYEIISLDINNLHQYVNLPEYILDKWKDGIISNAMLSDILRTTLLCKYGGIWLDATVYLTDRIPDIILNSDFFLYKHTDVNDVAEQYNSWFIKSVPNNEILMKVKEFMFEYWKNENKIREYFLWHVMLSLILENCSNSNIYPEISDYVPAHLSSVLNLKFDQQYWDLICRMSSIHKLTYKSTIDNAEDSFYKYIIDKSFERNN